MTRPAYTQGAVIRRERRIRERVMGVALLALGVGAILMAGALYQRSIEIEAIHRAITAKPVYSGQVFKMPGYSAGEWA